MLSCALGWIIEWILLYSARDLEERNVEMTNEVKLDRSLMPLATCSLPAAALAGAVWFAFMHGVPAAIEIARGLQTVS